MYDAHNLFEYQGCSTALTHKSGETIMDKSQKERVLDWLKSGHNITQLQALRKWGIMRLGAVIFRIKGQYGKDYIAREMIDVINRYGKKVRIARYSL